MACEGDNLFLGADHPGDFKLCIELQLSNSLKALLQVRLNSLRILRLRQDLQKLVVRQEEEPAAVTVKRLLFDMFMCSDFYNCYQ